MLANFRNMTKWGIIVILVIFVATIALEYGARMSGTQRARHAVSVNGEEIPYRTVDIVYTNRIRDAVVESDTDRDKIYRDVVNDLIAEKLAMQKAAEWGMEPTADEIVAQIQNRFFTENGVFDAARFEAAKRQVSSSQWIPWERQVRQDITLWKIFNAITVPVVVSDDELRDFYDIRFQKALLRHILISPADYISDQKARTFYENRPDSFFIPERTRGRHILFRIPEDADENTRLAARAQAEAALIRLSSGTPFNHLYQEASSAGSPGVLAEELDWFYRGQMVGEFDTVAFTHPVGVPTEIITTPFGYHVALFTDRQERHREDFDEIKTSIKNAIVSDSEIAAARAEAEAIREEIQSGAPFERMAYGHSDALSRFRGGLIGHVTPGEMNPDFYPDTGVLRIAATEIGTRSGNQVVVAPMITRALFELEIDEISDVVQSTHGFHILRVEDRQGGNPDLWEDLRPQVQREYDQLLKQQIFNDWTESLKNAAKIVYGDETKRRLGL